jgi:threonylcarbamoyladenosine tRNA methylthiotransferase MtaB
MATLDVITLGCRLNAYETEVMREHAAAAGLADAVIVNTCAVTAEAVRQAEQSIRKLRRDRPGTRIIVTGCAAQIDPGRFASMDGVDYVIGNGEKMRPETFRALATETSAKVVVEDIMSVKETAPHLLDGFGTRARAYVQIQNGCDHRCTFCIIPFGRGPSRSVPAGEVVRQVRHLVEAGYPEIVLTGVDITDYGKGLPGDMTLGRLVRQILRHVPELPRLRLSSIDSVEVDRDLLASLADDPRLMPHLHLSLQAGDDLILKRMKRRHSRADAITFCAQARRLRPDIAFGADLIAGFPTETDDMFARTVDLLEACGIAFVHAFPFSPREGTPAARMPAVPRPVIKARAEALRQQGARMLERHLGQRIGRTMSVVVEAGPKGRAEDFTEVVLDRASEPGRITSVQIGAHDGRRLIGAIVGGGGMA